MRPSRTTSNSAADVTAAGDARVQIGHRYSIDVYNCPNPKRCLADLRLADPREEKARIEQTKGGLLRDSYKWILDNDEFLRWRHDQHSSLLWTKGDAGKGKTILLCGIIDELSEHSAPSDAVRKNKGLQGTIHKLSRRLKGWPASSHRHGPLSFLFCQATDPRLNTAVAVLRGLIYDLLRKKSSLMTHLQKKKKKKKKYEHGGRRILEGSNAFFSISQALLSMLRDPVASGTYIVVDALDECETRLPQLLGFIADTVYVSLNVK